MAAPTPTPKEKLPVKINIKREGYEISIEANLELIKTELDQINELKIKMDEYFGGVEVNEADEAVPSTEEVDATPTGDIPTIKPVASNFENVKSLFATPWGKTPRTVAEVMKALEVNGIFDRTPTISTYLLRLVQRSELRRIEKEGKWTYFQIPGKS